MRRHTLLSMFPLYETFEEPSCKVKDPQKELQIRGNTPLTGLSPDYPTVGPFITCDGPGTSWQMAAINVSGRNQLELAAVSPDTLNQCVVNKNKNAKSQATVQDAESRVSGMFGTLVAAQAKETQAAVQLANDVQAAQQSAQQADKQQRGCDEVRQMIVFENAEHAGRECPRICGNMGKSYNNEFVANMCVCCNK